MTTPFLVASNIHVQYATSEFSLRVASFSMQKGEHCALLGPSGCGKTTFIEVIAGVKQADQGEVNIDGVEILSLSETERRAFRLNSIGFVFQQFELLPYLTVLDNVLLPVRLAGRPDSTVRERALQLLGSLGLGNKEMQYPDQLSQGEKQRVAIARSVIREPAFIIADEPTGNLDTQNSEAVMNLLFQVAEDIDASMLVVTHDTSMLPRFQTVHSCEELFT